MMNTRAEDAKMEDYWDKFIKDLKFDVYKKDRVKSGITPEELTQMYGKEDVEMFERRIHDIKE